MASAAEFPPGDLICNTREIPIQCDIDHMVPPAHVEDIFQFSGWSGSRIHREANSLSQNVDNVILEALKLLTFTFWFIIPIFH